VRYKGIEVRFIQLVSYLGDEYKDKDFKEVQAHFKKMIKKHKFPYGCSFECPIEDMICINLDGSIDIADSGKEKLLKALYELKKIFPDSYINLNLEDFLPEGNTIDLTGEEFKKLYLLQEVDKK
jgi:hypothetical protein